MSIKAAFISRVIVVLLGTVIAKWMACHRFKGKIVIETVLRLPLVIPPSVIVFFCLEKTAVFTWLIMCDKL
ncbi:hypothetical protein [Parageobacillus toebii]|uniref:ABC-type molybdate transport system permease subunit n=1 Tax=Parageobacillus toebii NBRC 107807 TaxID=1223503 RepID=A0AA89SRL6_9BACL|nr:hypothetical protein [Parageobacillus toebii]MBB3868259.1 ABC-type molybdate transport system permease subunit [Parageobacillus toebii NBRC 107807]